MSGDKTTTAPCPYLNGLTSQCRKCHMEGSIRTRDPVRHADRRRDLLRCARARNPEIYRQREREASRKRKRTEHSAARNLLNAAVRRGDIVRDSVCRRCGAETKLQGHHEDYSKPLEVVWLCSECHGKAHRKVSAPDAPRGLAVVR